MFSKNALTVLEKRYLQRDETGVLCESTEELFRRVAAAVAAAESAWGAQSSEIKEIEERFFEALVHQRFMPNSPTLMNAGKKNGQLSACFVLPVPDTLEGIFETCKNAALIHKTGGGTGFSFNRLRPANDRVNTTAGVASGPVSFMTVYDAATEAIRQGGTRRGANMGILNVNHPDIEEFIACKRQTDRLNNFNISVGITEQFMQAVEANRDIDLIHPGTGKVVRKVSARNLFEKIVENAHATGEPGLVFLDRINALDPIIQTPDENGVPIAGTEDIEATNPCGEQPLGPGDACNLGSINLAKFINDSSSDFAWDKLNDMVALSVRFLDDIIEANCYPFPFIAQASRNNRRIGLGVMGWAEALIRLNIPYNSNAALDKASQLMSFIQEKAHAASTALAAVRGTFPNYRFSTWFSQGIPMRNATVTTIAPTGTISIIAGTTSGIEPVFAVSFIRRVLGGMELIEIDPLFEQTAQQRGFYSDKLMREIALAGTIQHIDGIPEDVKRIWVCSHDIDYAWHVKMQARFQQFTDCAVSKTINLRFSATVDDIRNAYMLAYQLGLKGLTVYRDTSRQGQVLNLAQAVGKEHDLLLPVTAVTSCGISGVGTAIDTKVSEDKFSHQDSVSRQQSKRAASGGDTWSCPECGSSTGSRFYSEACERCLFCGYTKC